MRDEQLIRFLASFAAVGVCHETFGLIQIMYSGVYFMGSAPFCDEYCSPADMKLKEIKWRNQDGQFNDEVNLLTDRPQATCPFLGFCERQCVE